MYYIEIKPFHLYHDREKIWLDPVHALLCWQHVARIEVGPIFRRINKFDQVVESGANGKYLVSFSFENFEAFTYKI